MSEGVGHDPATGSRSASMGDMSLATLLFGGFRQSVPGNPSCRQASPSGRRRIKPGLVRPRSKKPIPGVSAWPSFRTSPERPWDRSPQRDAVFRHGTRPAVRAAILAENRPKFHQSLGEIARVPGGRVSLAMVSITAFFAGMDRTRHATGRARG